MVVLVKGSNAVLTSAFVDVSVSSNQPMDVSAVLLGPDGKVRSDQDLIFFNHPDGPGVGLTSAGTIALRLSSVPTDVSSVAILASLNGGQAFSTVRGLEVRVTGGPDVVTFRPTDLGPERALIAVEVYRRGHDWKVRASGQGWKDGLAGLARSFGVVVDDDGDDGAAPGPAGTPPTTEASSFSGAGTPADPTDPPKQLAVAMQKVELVKQGDTRPVATARVDGTVPPIRVNLDWSRPSLGNGTDLDLGCFVEMDDGGITVIQPLGRSFGYVRKWPWIKLSPDDRTGNMKSGENLVVHRADLIRRVLVFAMIYSGSGFRTVDAVLTVDDGSGLTVMKLNNPTPRRTWCAVAMITSSPGGLEIRKEERYFAGHAEADKHYGFGFQWRGGYKRSR